MKIVGMMINTKSLLNTLQRGQYPARARMDILSGVWDTYRRKRWWAQRMTKTPTIELVLEGNFTLNAWSIKDRNGK